LRPLPYREPERLMQVSLVFPGRFGMPPRDDMVWSYHKARVFRGAQLVFERLALYSADELTLNTGEAGRGSSETIDPDYLPTLGVQPALGRNFLPEENQPPKPRAVVLISDELWNRRFNADPSVLGHTVDIDNAPYTIIGVLPAGFHGLSGRA